MEHRRFARFAVPLLVFGIGLISVPQPALASEILVTTTVDDFGDNPADCSLREAINAANLDAAFGGCPAGSGADTITVPSGTYLTTRPADGNGGDLDVLSNMTIAGAGALSTAIDGNMLDRVFDVDPGVSVTISGLTVRNGAASGIGGGIRNLGTLSLDGLVLSGNRSDGDGGGIANKGAAASLTVSATTVSTNQADGNGGGIANSEGTASLANVTVSGNTTSGSGGGLRNASGGTVDLNNVTIARNTANLDASGGGDGGGVESQGATVNIGNSIVGNNDDASAPGAKEPDCFATLTSRGHNLIEDTEGCTINGSTAGNITGESPAIDPLGDNGGPTPTHALRENSPAVDAGSPANPGSGGTACEPNDQRGVSRPQGSRCDIGAFERQAGGGQHCFGKPVTITGTAGPDTLTGTKRRDGIAGLAGADVLSGRGDRDRLCAGGGKDRAVGGAGDDRVKGGGGNDRLVGKAGDDTLKGGPGRDQLNGGAGFDICRGGPGRDRFRSCEVSDAPGTS